MISNGNLIDGLIMVVINEETPRHIATDFLDLNDYQFNVDEKVFGMRMQ